MTDEATRIYDNLTPGDQERLKELLDAFNKVRNLEGRTPMSLEEMMVFQAEMYQSPIITKWDALCAPVSKWIREREDLTWFVSPERMCEETRRNLHAIKTTLPDISDDVLQDAAYATWAVRLMIFALKHGYGYRK